jgi:hypothetical protein
VFEAFAYCHHPFRINNDRHFHTSQGVPREH